VLPLVKKDGQPELAHEVHHLVRSRVQAEYDEGGSIGKRYRRQMRSRTPVCLTVDHQSVEDRTVTCAIATRWRRSACRSRASRRRSSGGSERAVETPNFIERRQMDFDLTDEQRLIKQTAREFHRQRDRPADAGKRP